MFVLQKPVERKTLSLIQMSSDEQGLTRPDKENIGSKVSINTTKVKVGKITTGSKVGINTTGSRSETIQRGQNK